jgi:hypothetical protein
MNEKFFYLVVAVLFMAFFTACEKKEKEVDIVGLWTFVSGVYDIENPQNPELAEELKRFAKEALESLSQGEYTIEFKSNKTFIIGGQGGTATGTYAQNGNSLSITLDEEPMDVGATIYVTQQNEILTWNTVINLDFAVEGQATLREMGFIKYESKMTFKKVSK